MRSTMSTTALTLACATLLLTACDEPTTSSSEVLGPNAALAASPGAANAVVANAAIIPGAPFMVRAPLDPYFINQAPDFMVRSHTRSDLVIQRLVSQPSVGAWHTHPGPSFGIVEAGRVMITRSTKRGCTTEVYEAGEAYFEVADEVHRATVLGPGVAVEYKARFNTPVGAPFGTPASDPGC